MSRHALRTIAAAICATVIGALPVFLLGGMAVQVGADLAFTSAGLGVAISASFAASALASIPAGRLAERRGAAPMMRVGVGVAAASLLGVAAVAHSLSSLAVLLAVGGVGNAMTQIGANLGLARAVPRGRQGFAFGVKQAAVPVATLLAGLSVPAVALTIGWRWAYIFGAVAGAAVLLLVPPDGAAPTVGAAAVPTAAPELPGRTRTGPLVVIALGGVLAAGAAGALGGFLVAWSVESGIDPGAAGLLMALGSVIGLLARLVDGYLADRRQGGHLVVVAAQLVAGAGGLFLLATGVPAALVAGTLLGYGLGWSWPGLLNFAVVRLNRAGPAAATGVTQTGIYIGAGGGPLVFGLLATHASYPVAWSVAGASMVGAGLLMLVARGWIHRDRARV